MEGTVNRSIQKQLNQDLCPLVDTMGAKGKMVQKCKTLKHSNRDTNKQNN